VPSAERPVLSAEGLADSALPPAHNMQQVVWGEAFDPEAQARKKTERIEAQRAEEKAAYERRETCVAQQGAPCAAHHHAGTPPPHGVINAHVHACMTHTSPAQAVVLNNGAHE
jgi:hypothetical protein